MTNRYKVTINNTRGEFVANVVLSDGFDYVENHPVSSIGMARLYAEEFLLETNQHCSIKEI